MREAHRGFSLPNFLASIEKFSESSISQFTFIVNDILIVILKRYDVKGQRGTNTDTCKMYYPHKICYQNAFKEAQFLGTIHMHLYYLVLLITQG